VPDPAAVGDAGLQMGALGVLVASAGVIWGYVVWVVPRFRALAARRAGRRRRRPGAGWTGAV